MLCSPSARPVCPDYLIHKVLFAEYFVQQHPQIGGHAVIHVQVQGAIGGHKLTAQLQHVFHHFHIGVVRHFITVRRYLYLFSFCPPAYLKGVAGTEGRVEIN